MTPFLSIIIVVLVGMLLVLASLHPERTKDSIFELRRRQRMGDKRASDTLRRETLLLQVSVLNTPARAMLIALVAILLFQLFSWWGLLASLLVALSYEQIAHLSFFAKMTNRLYARREERLLEFISKYKKSMQMIGGKKSLHDEVRTVASKEELAHLLEASPIFSEDDKRLLENTLRFSGRTTSELMTPKEKVVTVDDSELLGPLVLDDLHKTGHTIFPVVKGDKVVGLLDSSDHSDLHTKESVHVRSVMRSEVVKIHEDMALDESLKLLLATKEQLVIVVDDNEQMVGVISLKDIVRALTG